MSFDTTVGQASDLWIDISKIKRDAAASFNFSRAQIAVGAIDVPLYVPPSTKELTLRGYLCRGSRLAITSCDIQEISPHEALWHIARQAKEARQLQQIDTRHFYRDLRRLSKHNAIESVIHRLRSEVQTPVDAYTAWVHYFDLIDDVDRNKMAIAIDKMQHPPFISIIMPTYNTPKKFLNAALASIERQVYPYWQLCIADDASPLPHVMRILQTAAQRDSRIQVVRRDTNGHISRASNSALALARHPWIALFDHDDELPEHALFEVAQAILENPEAKLIYTDEDKCDDQGRRKDPYFKPGYNLDLLRSQNYISHLGVYARLVVDSIGGFRSELDGSQDYDLVLRTIEQIKPCEIVHIPHVLYHWRILEGSAAASTQSKPYAYLAGEQALVQHLERQSVRGFIRHSRNAGLYHVRYHLPDADPHVSMIVLANDSLADMNRCVGSLRDITNYANFDIHFVQCATYGAKSRVNAGSFQHVKSFAESSASGLVKTLESAARGTVGDVLVFLDGQIEPIRSDWLTELVSNALREDAGAVAPKILTSNRKIYQAGLILGSSDFAAPIYRNKEADSWLHFGRIHLAQNYNVLAHDCFAVRRDRYLAAGGLDASLGFSASVMDLCLKLRKLGYINIWTPHAQLISHSRVYHPDTRKSAPATDVQLLHARWQLGPRGDPYFSPNLSISCDATTPSYPPRMPYSFRVPSPGGIS